MKWQQRLQQIHQQDTKALARCISLVENEAAGYQQFLSQLPVGHAPVIGITGPPGAGKSTLVDALIGEMVANGKKVAVLCVDPSSPFNLGALLGDRIRMSDWYSHPSVFIRSLATRGSLGGLHPQIIAITSLLQAAWFDYIIVETVGVGQSEIEIVGLADTTIVVLVPEAGDEVQTMKAGLMEIADIFVVNKSDRPDADLFVHHLKQMLAPTFYTKQQEVPIIKTTASQKKGIAELYTAIAHYQPLAHNQRHSRLLAEKAYQLIQQKRMKDIDKQVLMEEIERLSLAGEFNLYGFVEGFGC
ncbi:methylmalonyl Co-A mutase-associated GTPase MeaB [Parasediminibacterium sp. JCM 36343]|uniref:methylmalonyl Co-A mutase-associated GTPase MeaB n=1 Tax=Parasediminibacterium sp. JCM 36343 TaxID=3374279 RepID=UPI00397E3375